jgi:methionine-rich copper-binding protein CopC
MTQPSRRALSALCAVLALPLVVGAARLPHLKLKHAFPAPDTTLTTSPDAVRLWLSEPADLPATKVAVADAGGAPVAVARLTRGAQRDDPVVAKFVTPPTDGKYTVTWKAMSKDGHVVDGKYAFTVTLAK